MMKKNITILLLLLLSGCLTLSGNYRLVEIDKNGQEVTSGIKMHAQGSGIYTIRNGFCAAKPGAILRIIDEDTGKELKSESPYKC